MLNTYFYVLLTIIIVLEFIAQYLLSKSIIDSSNIYLFIGMFSYMLIAYLYYLLLLKSNKISTANALWNIFSTIGIALVGYLFLSEKFTLKELIAFIIIFIGSILLIP